MMIGWMSWEICMQVEKQQLEPDTEQQTFQIWKGICQGCILSVCLLNLYAEYIMWNAKLDEARAGIKIDGRNINNLLCRWHHPYGSKQRRAKDLLMNIKEEGEKVV